MADMPGIVKLGVAVRIETVNIGTNLVSTLNDEGESVKER